MIHTTSRTQQTAAAILTLTDISEASELRGVMNAPAKPDSDAQYVAPPGAAVPTQLN